MFERISHHWIVPLLLRGFLALTFIYHGLQLVAPATQWGTAWKPDLPMPVQVLVAWGELIGGIVMVPGFLTRAAAAGLGIIMLGAIVQVHWPHGYDVRHGGLEFALANLVICVALMLLGAGELSIDRLLRPLYHKIVKPRT